MQSRRIVRVFFGLTLLACFVSHLRGQSQMSVSLNGPAMVPANSTFAMTAIASNVTLPATLTLQATSSDPKFSPVYVQSTQPVGGGPQVYATGSTSGSGNYDIIFTATGTDGAGGYVTTSTTVRIYNFDTTPPSVPTGVNVPIASIQSNQMTVSWNPSTDDQMVYQYDISDNGTIVATVSGSSTSYNATVLPGTSHTFQVRARDWVGNISAWSASSQTVQSLIDDKQPPTQPGAISASFTSDGKLTISWGASTDNVAVTGYHITVNYDTDKSATFEVIGTKLEATVDVPMYHFYTITIIATDAANNKSPARGTTVTMPLVAPTINSQPGSLSISAGNTANFSVSAIGTLPLTYQWMKNSVAISGATNSTYSITNAQSADAASYTVAVSNSAGNITSNAASLTVASQAPIITSQPVSLAVSTGNSATFSVTATGSSPLAYQWTKDSAAISGATSSTYSIASAQTSDAGSYAVVVSNSAGSATSNPATLTVTSSTPTDTTPPSQPGAITVSGLTSSTVTLKWGPATDNVGVVDYKIVVQLKDANGSIVSTAFSTGTTATVSELSLGTAYYITIVALDAAGNQSTTAQTTNVTTSTSPYSSTPGQPLGLRVAGADSSSITMAWNPAVDGHAIDHYIIDCNGVDTTLGQDSAGVPVMLYQYTGLSPSSVCSIKVQAVDPAGSVSPWSDVVTASTSSALASLPATIAAPSAPGASLVASASADLQVDNHGSANYSIPLRIAPGRSGLVPHIALQYDSAAGNGVLGIGWSLSTGFPSAITRGRTILARDGTVRGVNFDSSDKFYLDGQRLLCVSGDSLAAKAGNLYRTEVDSFVSITATDSSGGSGVDGFSMVDKQGVQYFFGKYNNTSDALQVGGSGTNDYPYRFLIKHIQDAVGNYIDFQYQNLGAGEVVLSKISYTGSPDGQAPLSELDFLYTSRTDQPRTYIADRYFNHRARLGQILSIGPGTTSSTPTACYQLGYQNGSNGGLSRLTTVTPYLIDSSSDQLCPCSPTTISWQDYSMKLSTTTTTIGASGNPEDFTASMAWGDQLGNGKDQPIFTNQNQSSYILKLCDLDGDGKKDSVILYIPTGGTAANIGISFGLASGKSYAFDAATLTQFQNLFLDPGLGSSLLLQAEGPSAADRVAVADFDGDGLDDLLVHSFDGYLYLFHNTGTGFASPVKSSYPVGGGGNVQTDDYSFLVNRQIQLYVKEHYFIHPIPCDLNGDGRTDYVFMQTQRFFGSNNGSIITYTNIRTLVGVLSTPDGNFSKPFVIN